MKLKSVKVSDLGRIVTGKTPSTRIEDNFNGNIPFITPVDMVGHKHVVYTERYVSEKGAQSVKGSILPSKSVCVSCIGSDMGKSVITTETSVTNQQINSIIVNEDFDYRYVYYLMRTLEATIKCLGKNGTAVPILSKSKFSDIEVNIHNLECQQQIANILSVYDDLIENNQKQIKLLEEAAQRLYKEWFVDLRFPGHENTKIVDGIPEGWEEKKLFEFADVVMGQSPKSEFYNSNNDGLPFHQGVGSYGTRFVINDTYTSSITRVANQNSILFSVRAPVGRLNITKEKIVIGRGLAAINHKANLQSYLFYKLKERFYQDNLIGNGSIFASITKDELLNQTFIEPIFGLAENFNMIAVSIDKKIELLDKQIANLKEARDRLLPKLMSGELEV